jgi:hypothetical protein
MWVSTPAGRLAISLLFERTPHEARYPTTRIVGGLASNLGREGAPRSPRRRIAIRVIPRGILYICPHAHGQ